MKYYKLKRDLPTFNEGDIFYIDDFGNLVSNKELVVAYSSYIISKFPNILINWFKEIPEPERDSKTKHAFIEYMSNHKDERFFQAIRNFANEYLRYYESLNCIASVKVEDYNEQNSPVDMFYWECDNMLKEDDEIQS